MGFKQTNNYGIGDDNFTAFQETLDTTRRGLVEMSLSNYDNDSAPVVKVGSWFENNGSMFEVVTGDETPSGYGGIANSTTFYLYYDVSGDEFIYDSTAPTWNDALQGWYNSNDRALFSMYKDSGGTLYQDKSSIQQESFPRNLVLNDVVANDVVANDVVANDVDVSGYLAPSEGVSISGFIHSTTADYGDVYDLLVLALTVVGKEIIVSGVVDIGGNARPISKAKREDASTIKVYWGGAGGVGTTSLTTAGATVTAWSIAW